MIGMQDRLQRFHMNVNQEIGLNWKAFQLAIVPEIDCDKSFWFFLTPFPLGGTKNKLQRRRRDLKKLYVVVDRQTERMHGKKTKDIIGSLRRAVYLKKPLLK